MEVNPVWNTFFPSCTAGVCFSSCTKNIPSILIGRLKYSVFKKVKKKQEAAASHSPQGSTEKNAEFKHPSIFCLFSLSLKNIPTPASTCIHTSPESCHLRAVTINKFVLTLYAAAADNKASRRAGLKDKRLLYAPCPSVWRPSLAHA